MMNPMAMMRMPLMVLPSLSVAYLSLRALSKGRMGLPVEWRPNGGAEAPPVSVLLLAGGEGLEECDGVLPLGVGGELVVAALPDPSALAAKVAAEGVLVDAGKLCELGGGEGLAGRGYGNPPFLVSL